MKKQLAAIAASVLAVLGTVLITIAIEPSGRTQVKIVYAPPPAGDKPIAPTVAGKGDNTPLRDEAPPGTVVAKSPAAQQKAINASENAAVNTTTGPDVVPENRTLASPHQRGCHTRIVRNYSSRNGARPALLVAHFTVSPNRPGWSDVNSVVGLFNNTRAQASSNYVTDADGHCALIVPETQKAWTQAFFNPWSISIEEINTGSEPTYAGRKGLAKIGLVFSDAGRRWGIPLRHGRISSKCHIGRAGIVQHAELGACGGGHVDIGHYRLSQVIQAARAARCAPHKRAGARRRCIRRLAR
jgi:N-acetylmuramoyl-L-alanine amidase